MLTIPRRIPLIPYLNTALLRKSPPENPYFTGDSSAENPSQISRCHDNKHQKIPTSFCTERTRTGYCCPRSYISCDITCPHPAFPHGLTEFPVRNTPQTIPPQIRVKTKVQREFPAGNMDLFHFIYSRPRQALLVIYADNMENHAFLFVFQKKSPSGQVLPVWMGFPKIIM